MGKNICVIFELDTLGLAKTIVLGTVFSPQRCDGCDGEDRAEAADDQLCMLPHSRVVETGKDLHTALTCGDDFFQRRALLQQSSDLIASSSGGQREVGQQGSGQVGSPEDAHKEHVVSSIEHREDGTLLGVVGQTGLCRLGDDTLEGVADDINGIHDDERNESSAVRNDGQQTEHGERHRKKNQVTNDNERAVLTEFGIGVVDDHSDERVGNAIPDSHDGNDTAGQNSANTDNTYQEVGDRTDQHQVRIGSGVIQCITADFP